MIKYPVTYGDDLTQEQAIKSLKEIQIRARVVISLYLLTTQVANAADGTIPPPAPNAPAACPASSSENTGKQILAFIAVLLLILAIFGLG